MIFPWITVINPIVSIWINRPYRDAVKNAVFKVISTNAIHPTPAAPQ
jgi:hypothetical protein